jgi:hypothetical protein
MNANEVLLLKQPGVHSGYKTVANYRIYLEWETGYQEVRFRIEESTHGYFEFTQSHFIKTPEQGGAYRTSVSRDHTIDGALQRATRTILEYYNLAIANGHSPKKSWFVKNENY